MSCTIVYLSTHLFLTFIYLFHGTRTGDLTFSGRVLLRLLDEAKGIPIIFAAVMPTGLISFHVFSR